MSEPYLIEVNVKDLKKGDVIVEKLTYAGDWTPVDPNLTVQSAKIDKQSPEFYVVTFDTKNSLWYFIERQFKVKRPVIIPSK